MLIMCTTTVVAELIVVYVTVLHFCLFVFYTQLIFEIENVSVFSDVCVQCMVDVNCDLRSSYFVSVHSGVDAR